MKKANGILLTLVFLFGLLLVGCREEPAPLPQGDTRPTKPLPTGTPTPTPDPYLGIDNSWLEERSGKGFHWSRARARYANGEKWEFIDTPATGERDSLSDIEERILAGECVRLKDGTELDLDGNGTREKICFEDKASLQIGAALTGAGHYDCYSGVLYGVCLDAENPARIQIVAEVEMVDGRYSYDVLSYIQEEGYAWLGSQFLLSSWEKGAFSPKQWSGLTEKGTFIVNDKEYLYQHWEMGGEQYSEIFEIPEGMQSVNRDAVTTADIFAYNWNRIYIVGYIPAETELLVLAENERWLYVTSYEYDVSAYIHLLRDEDGVTVEAPYEVTLEAALRDREE